MFLETRLQKRKEQGLFRSLHTHVGLIDFTSNDYFGFANTGATGSRLLTGNSPFYEELEERIATFHRANSCLIYNSGYTANLGLLSAIGIEEVSFIYDLEIHASMIDGMQLSKSKCIPFRHNDLNSLERRLQQSSPPAFVLVESLYSMSGDVAPLREIVVLCETYGANLIVDEAHATGIYGLNGEGLVVELGLESRVFARVHTFSKALGAHGACVLGSPTLKSYLLNFSRPLIYTTALPPSVLTHIGAKYEKLQREAQIHQKRLKSLITYFNTKRGIEGSQSPIQSIPVIAYTHTFIAHGLDVRIIRPPTVPRGKASLRVVLHSFNREDEIDRLIEVLK